MIASLLAASFISAPLLAADAEDKKLDVSLLVQPQVTLRQDANYSNFGNTNDDPNGFATDFFLRRARLIVSGKVSDNVNFFAETDTPNLGRYGDWSTKTYMQDAWVEFVVNPSLMIDAGMLLVPFSHHGAQGAGSLLMVDYHGSMLKYPTGSNLVWRDAGVMLRGELFNSQLIEYRLAITNGVQAGANCPTTDNPCDPNTILENTKTPIGDAAIDPVNASDLPRVTGRVVLSAWDSDGGPTSKGFFYDGMYIKTESPEGAKGKKVVTPGKQLQIGASFDFQPNAIATPDGKTTNWMAFNADIFTDMPTGDRKAFTGQADFFMYNAGEDSSTTGMGAMAEAGFRMRKFQPVVGMDWYNVTNANAADAEGEKAGDYMAFMGGLNWLYLAQNANVKAQVGMARTADGVADTDDKFLLSAVLQTQLLY